MKRKDIWKEKPTAAKRQNNLEERRRREREDILVGLVLCLSDLARQKTE